MIGGYRNARYTTLGSYLRELRLPNLSSRTVLKKLL